MKKNFKLVKRPTEYKIGLEKKTVSITPLIKPSLHKKMKEVSSEKNISMAQIIENALVAYLY